MSTNRLLGVRIQLNQISRRPKIYIFSLWPRIYVDYLVVPLTPRKLFLISLFLGLLQ